MTAPKRLEELKRAVRARQASTAAIAAGGALLAGATLGEVTRAGLHAAAPLCNERYYMRLDEHAGLRRLNTNHGLLSLASGLRLVSRVVGRERALLMMSAVWQMVVECSTEVLVFPERPLQAPEPASLSRLLLEGDVPGSLALLRATWVYTAARPALREALLFAGCINLEEAIDRQLRNIGHKGIYAQKMLQLANSLGWEAALPALECAAAYIATGPNFYALYDLVCSRQAPEREETWLDNRRPLGPREAEDLAETVLHAPSDDVLTRVAALLDGGVAALALADEITATAARLVLDCHPDAWLVPVHAFDYCSAANDWMRQSPGVVSQRAIALEALFVNEVARCARLEPRRWLQGPCHSPHEISQSIALRDATTAVALLRGYLEVHEADPELFEALALATARKNHDSHDLKYCQATLDEYQLNRSGHREVLLMALTKYLSHVPDRPECQEAWEVLVQ